MKTTKCILVCLTVFTISTCLVIGLGSVQVRAESKPLTIRLGYTHAPILWDNPEHNAALVFKNVLEKRSSGQIKVNLFPSQTLGPAKESLQNVSADLLEVFFCGSGASVMFMPEGQAFGIPYLFPSESVAWKVLDSDLTKELSQLYIKRHQIRLLALGGEGGFAQTTNSRHPIRTLADWKGLKIRTMEDAKQMKMVESLGANPTPIDWAECYPALKTGVADGQLNPLSILLGGKVYEVQKYLTLDNHAYATMWMVASEKFMQGLSEDLRRAVMDAGYQAAVASRGVARLKDTLALEELAPKMEIYSPRPAEMAKMRAATKPVVDWMKTEIDPQWVDRVLEEVERAKASFPLNQ